MLANQLLILVFFLLNCGLLSLGTLLSRIFIFEETDQSQPSQPLNKGISLLIGLFAFCVVCNALLIIPSLFEALLGAGTPVIPSLHRIAIDMSSLAGFFIVLLGIASLFKYFPTNCCCN